MVTLVSSSNGELAHMVERSLSMREVPGSIPGFSRQTFLSHVKIVQAVGQLCPNPVPVLLVTQAHSESSFLGLTRGVVYRQKKGGDPGGSARFQHTPHESPSDTSDLFCRWLLFPIFLSSLWSSCLTFVRPVHWNQIWSPRCPFSS